MSWTMTCVALYVSATSCLCMNFLFTVFAVQSSRQIKMFSVFYREIIFFWYFTQIDVFYFCFYLNCHWAVHVHPSDYELGDFKFYRVNYFTLSLIVWLVVTHWSEEVFILFRFFCFWNLFTLRCSQVSVFISI